MARRNNFSDIDALSALAAGASATRDRNQGANAARKIRRKGVVLSVSMPQEDEVRIREAADFFGMPLSVYVRVACREYERNHIEHDKAGA